MAENERGGFGSALGRVGDAMDRFAMRVRDTAWKLREKVSPQVPDFPRMKPSEAASPPIYSDATERQRVRITRNEAGATTKIERYSVRPPRLVDAEEGQKARARQARERREAAGVWDDRERTGRLARQGETEARRQAEKPAENPDGERRRAAQRP